MNTVTLFDFNQTPVRVMMDERGEPWWVAADVGRALEIANVRDATATLDADEKGVGNADTLGGVQELATVSESGLYALIFKSRKPVAKLFRKWVIGEVLPAIRRTGSFLMSGAPATDAERIESVQRHLFEVMARFMTGVMTTADLNATTNWAGRVSEFMDHNPGAPSPERAPTKNRVAHGSAFSEQWLDAPITVAQIAAKSGKSKSSVRRWLRSFGDKLAIGYTNRRTYWLPEQEAITDAATCRHQTMNVSARNRMDSYYAL